jgi:hypothetical protein
MNVLWSPEMFCGLGLMFCGRQKWSVSDQPKIIISYPKIIFLNVLSVLCLLSLQPSLGMTCGSIFKVHDKYILLRQRLPLKVFPFAPFSKFLLIRATFIPDCLFPAMLAISLSVALLIRQGGGPYTQKNKRTKEHDWVFPCYA